MLGRPIRNIDGEQSRIESACYLFNDLDRLQSGIGISEGTCQGRPHRELEPGTAAFSDRSSYIGPRSKPIRSSASAVHALAKCLESTSVQCSKYGPGLHSTALHADRRCPR